MSDVSVLRCDIQYTVQGTSILGAPGTRAPMPHYFMLKEHQWIGPLMIMLQHAIKSQMHYKLYLVHHMEVIDCCNCFELINFRSCKLANLPNQRSSSYADNGSICLYFQVNLS